MALPSADGMELTQAICEALGLDPWLVRRVIIDINADDPGPLPVYVEMYGTDKLLEVDWAAGLKGAEICETTKPCES